jgi:hypothetical protein
MSLVAGDVGSKTILPDGAQVDHLSENTVGHGVRVRGISSPVVNPVLIGDIGEELISSFSAQNVPTSSVRADAATLSMTAGVWEVSGQLVVYRNSATFSSTLFTLSLITVAGDAYTGEVEGYNFTIVESTIPTTFSRTVVNLIPVRVVCDGSNITVAGTTTSGTTLRLKRYIGIFSSGTPQISGIIRATRIA